MFRLLNELDLSYIINSQILWLNKLQALIEGKIKKESSVKGFFFVRKEFMKRSMLNQGLMRDKPLMKNL